MKRQKPDPDITHMQPMIDEGLRAISLDVGYAVKIMNWAKQIEKRQQRAAERVAARKLASKPKD